MRKAIHRSYCSVVTAAALAFFSAGPAQSQTAPFIAKAEQAYMVDAETGTVLLSQNENQPFSTCIARQADDGGGGAGCAVQGSGDA